MEKWKIPREEDLKSFASIIKSLITQNTDPVKRKINNSMDKENEIVVETTTRPSSSKTALKSQNIIKRTKY